jgi:hypothetical protein
MAAFGHFYSFSCLAPVLYFFRWQPSPLSYPLLRVSRASDLYLEVVTTPSLPLSWSCNSKSRITKFFTASVDTCLASRIISSIFSIADVDAFIFSPALIPSSALRTKCPCTHRSSLYLRSRSSYLGWTSIHIECC